MKSKIKDKKLFNETVFYKKFYNEKIRIAGVFLWIKDADPVFSPDPGDPKRPDPTLQSMWRVGDPPSPTLHPAPSTMIFMIKPKSCRIQLNV